MGILNKLTLKNLKLNKSRTIVTIIGILLSTALITVVAGVFSSGQQTLINAQKMMSGDYDLTINSIDDNSIDDIKSNRDVQNVYYSEELGVARLDNPKNDYRPYIGVKAYSKNSFGSCYDIPLAKGDLPKNSSEIILSKKLVDNTNKKYNIGDSITLSLGNRIDENGNTIDNSMSYGFTEKDDVLIETKETLSKGNEKTYKIVGFIDESFNDDYMYSDSSACSSAVTVLDSGITSPKNAKAYVRFNDSSEKDFIKVTSDITGVPVSTLNKVINDEIYYDDIPSLCPNAEHNDIGINTTLLSYKGYGIGDRSMTMFLILALIVIGIIILTSIFVIRNSFSISITEKTKLYGMLSSVGTTSKQIRHNVLFEGVVLGLIGITGGVLLGVGVTALLIWLLNVLLSGLLNGINVAFSIPLYAVAAAVILSAVTIVISTLSTAFKASKIPPITAIRGNNDVKIKNKKLKSPKIIDKVFGIGGTIAYKNLKRNRKKYRTTVISIVISVTLFIIMSSFVQYGTKYSQQYYKQIDFSVTVHGDEINNVKMQNEFDTIRQLDLINTEMYFKTYYISSDTLYDNQIDEFKDNNTANCSLMYIDDNSFRELSKVNGLSYDDMKSKALLLNFDDEDFGFKKSMFTDLKENDKISVDTANKKGKHNITFGRFVEHNTDNLSLVIGTSDVILLNEKYAEKFEFGNGSFDLYLGTDSPDRLEKAINDLGYSELNITNYNTYVKQNNTIVLILAIFVYGFIIVISLISITNIFNTITTTMKLRSKEFAILKSTGMTKREFNRMIRLESLFYGTKSLLIGIPLGIIGSILILKTFNMMNDFAYTLPLIPILISIVFVFLMVWLIMKFSIHKVSKQNIIETIRNDNI